MWNGWRAHRGLIAALCVIAPNSGPAQATTSLPSVDSLTRLMRPWVEQLRRLQLTLNVRQPNQGSMGVIEEILRLREAGHTTCAIADVRGAETGPSAVDRIVQAHGFRAIATEWHEVSAAEAQAIVTTLLHRDLAYGGEIMPLAIASDLATQFVDLAPEPQSFFTNGDWSMTDDATTGPATMGAFDPISDATLDSGVVCLGDGRAALFWVQDDE
jgi:hypothetical protein